MRLQFCWFERGLLSHLFRRFRRLGEYLTVVSPETLLRWYRKRLRRFWAYPHRQPRNAGRPPVSAETRQLIRRIKQFNPAARALPAVVSSGGGSVLCDDGSIKANRSLRIGRRTFQQWS